MSPSGNSRNPYGTNTGALFYNSAPFSGANPTAARPGTVKKKPNLGTQTRRTTREKDNQLHGVWKKTVSKEVQSVGGRVVKKWGIRSKPRAGPQDGKRQTDLGQMRGPRPREVFGLPTGGKQKRKHLFLI